MRRAQNMVSSCDPRTLTVREIMEDAVFTCGPGISGVAVARLQAERNFGSVPVVEKDMTLLGLISEFDLLKAMTNGKNLETVMAREIMTPEDVLVTVTEDMPIMDLAKLLQQTHLIRVPVVRGKTLVGIVARRDIVFGYVKALSTYWP